jgi:hypothetical protein
MVLLRRIIMKKLVTLLAVSIALVLPSRAEFLQMDISIFGMD